jgi:deazaflavin-dependent oxidoreductase (nitroreductase family)
MLRSERQGFENQKIESPLRQFNSVHVSLPFRFDTRNVACLLSKHKGNTLLMKSNATSPNSGSGQVVLLIPAFPATLALLSESLSSRLLPTFRILMSRSRIAARYLLGSSGPFRAVTVRDGIFSCGDGLRKPMNQLTDSDPAEHSALMRLLYRNWRPTRVGRWINRLSGWWSGLGLPPRFQAALEVRGRTSGRRRSNPVVIATLEGKSYLVSMLGKDSDWVKNVEAANGDVVIRQGRRRRVHLAAVPPDQRAPIIREYVRIAISGRRHFPVVVGAPLADFEAIASRYPVYRIDSHR